MAKRVKIPGRLESAETGNIVTGADAVMDDEKGKTQVVINSEVDAAIISLAQGKQDNLTFDNAPTEDSPNPVTSAGVYTADKVLSDAIEAILLLIPSAASALNKLVDMQTMNSSIATATASFKGTYNLVSDLHLGVDATHEQIGAALDALSLGADNNDYAFVQVPNSATAPTEIRVTERYKFNGTNWLFEYDLNNSGFTQGQWNAINSGVTSLLVSKLSDLPTNAELTTLLAGKQDNLTFDNVPTAGSPNPVKSGGVYAQNNEIVALINALDAAKQDVLTFDNAPVEGSPNPVKSGGVYTAISAVQAAIVALDAEKQNVLTFDSTPMLGSPNPVMSSGIKTELNRIDGNITTLNDLYEALTQSALVIVQPSDTWPVASPSTSTIYRVIDRTNTPPQNYSDYMWNGSVMVLMAEYDNAIDDVPTAGSNNLVKSGGVYNETIKIGENRLDIDRIDQSKNKEYSVNVLSGSPEMQVVGDKKVLLSKSITDYFYGNNHVVFSSGEPSHKVLTFNNIITSISAPNEVLSPADIYLWANATIFISNITINDVSGVRFLLDIIDKDNHEIRLRLNQAKMQAEIRTTNGVFQLNGKQTINVYDKINVFLSRNESQYTLGYIINDNIDTIEILDSYFNQIDNTPIGTCEIYLLDYSDANLNLQGKCSYESIYIFNRKIENSKALLCQKDYIKYNHISEVATNLSGTGSASDWNENISYEVCGVLHDEFDRDMPYKIAVGGYNGQYSEEIVGKTNFAYSKDLITWTYVSNTPPIDVYTEDGTIIKFNNLYYYYAETMPNRSVELWTSPNFVDWTYVGKVLSPDNDPTLADLPSSECSIGSPTAIVKDGVVYVFVEYGYTSNTNHSNRVYASDDGIHFRQISQVPDILRMEDVATILPYPTWTINNFEGICKNGDIYYAWISITNKTVTPTIYKMYEMRSKDLISWEWTGADFDGVTFSRVSDNPDIFFTNDGNTIKTIFAVRESEKLPEEFNLTSWYENICESFEEIYNSYPDSKKWYLTDPAIPYKNYKKEIKIFSPGDRQGVLCFIPVESFAEYEISFNSVGRVVISGYINGTFSYRILEIIEPTRFKRKFKIVNGVNNISIALTGWNDQANAELLMQNVTVKKVSD